MNSCRVCASRRIVPILDLGHHALADRFLSPAMLREPETSYPLRVRMCLVCGYAGNEFVVPAGSRYRDAEYSYTASNSTISIQHFGELADDICQRIGVPERVIDIGGNDGTLLLAFRSRGTPSLINIEPSHNTAELARGAQVVTIDALWGAEPISIRAGHADLVVSTNTMNHASDPDAFVREVSRVLAVGGHYVFEVPSLAEMVARCAFDTIYMEHVSYFSLRSLAVLLEKHGLAIIEAQTIAYMGGSLRVYARKVRPFAAAKPRIEIVEPESIFDVKTYALMTRQMEAFRNDLYRRICALRVKGERVIGVGAAAKGNTLLTYCSLGPGLLDCVLETSPYKIGKYTPRTHIPIIEEVKAPEGAHALILPWNIADHLIAKLSYLRLSFIVPAPTTIPLTIHADEPGSEVVDPTE